MNTTNDQSPDTRSIKPSSTRSILLWTGLILISGIPRVLGAFLLPNAFGDAYSYLEIIEAMPIKNGCRNIFDK